MLVSCSNCSGQHKRGAVCPNNKNSRKKEANYISRFRSSQVWRKKSNEIKQRDKFLCQVCLLDRTYVFKDLEVHHISPIVKNWEKRLTNSNLITLCKYCHKQAENGNINAARLYEIARKNENVSEGF